MPPKMSKSKNLKTVLLGIREKISEKIRKRRKAIDLDTKVLASKVGLSQSSISNIENNKQSIPAERLWQFAVALGCSPNDLLPPVPDEVKKFDKNLKKIEDDEVREFAKAVINIT